MEDTNMGLDSIWALRPEHEREVEAEHPVFDPPLRLCGGLCSNYGHISFRGGYYSWFIEDVSGVSLYQTRVPNEGIRRIAEALERYTPTPEDLEAFTQEELNDLKRMFRAYADAGAWLAGWW
jgi:hypothetical protein